MDTFYNHQINTISNMNTMNNMTNMNNVKLLKNKMTLDFNSPVSQDKKAKLKTCVLESPDLKLLKLGSPELERMIIQQNGMVTATPTPSASLPYFLKQEHEPTEEQEQYAKGFVDALNQLHQSNGQSHETQTHQQTHHSTQQTHHSTHQTHHSIHQSTHHSLKNVMNDNQINSHPNHQTLGQSAADTSSDLTLVDPSTGRRNSLTQMAVTGATKFAMPPIPSTVATTTSSGQSGQTEHYVSVSSCQTNGAHVMINNSRSTHLPPYSQAVTTNSVYPMAIKVEPTQVQSKTMRAISPPMVDPLSPSHVPNTSLAQPIDMADQERIKLERKRLRNRIAASKCRRRKLERISKLEEKVKVLKGDNSELSVVVNKLRDQACQLKQQIMDHVKCGCQLMVPQ